MKKTLASGLAAVLVAGGLGLATGPAQATSAPAAASRAALGPLPLDLCGLLPLLCEAPIVGDLLVGVDGALVDLLGTSTTDNPELLLENIEGLVQAVIETLTGAGPDGQAVADAIAKQLQNSGLDPAVLTQVLAGLSEAGVPGGSVLSDLVNTLLTSVEGLVNGLLGIGGQTPNPAQVQALIAQITAALAAGDAAALQDLLGNLLTSLPGGSNLDLSTLTGLVNQIVAALQGGLGGASVPQVVGNVDGALNGGNLAATPSATPTLSSPKGYFTSRRPAIRGTGTAGASVSVRTKTGTLLGTATVNSAGTFVVTSRNLKVGAYRVTATQTLPGRAASAQSAGRSFRVVSAKPVIQTKSRATFTTSRPKIKGIGYPKTRVVLRSAAGKKLGSATVRADGTWTIKSKKLSNGKQNIKAVQTGHGKKKSTKVRTIRIR